MKCTNEKVNNFENYNLLTDSEIILTNENDLLGNKIYVEQLENAIKATSRNNKTETVGLIGNWGSGKSSIVKTLHEKLKNEVIDDKKVRFIHYNAWKFNKDSFRKTFLIKSIESNKQLKKI